MSYSDQKFYARSEKMVTNFGFQAGTSTATASLHAPGSTAVARLPKYVRATTINAIRVAVDTVCGAGLTTPTLNFLNGTLTFATVAIGTNTAGQYVSAVMTASNANIAAAGQPTVNFVGTATASANTANGNYTVYFEEQEQPS